jgi:hypothetical protein
LDCDGFLWILGCFLGCLWWFMMVYDGWWWLMIVSMMELKWWLRDDLFMMICMIVYDGFWLFMMVCVFEMFGGCDWDLRRCKSEVLGELLRQKWQDSLRCLMSWGQISDHPKGIVGMIPKSGQIASFDLSGSEGETLADHSGMKRQSGWISWASQRFTVTYRDFVTIETTWIDVYC